jgi:hypothetical protein
LVEAEGLSGEEETVEEVKTVLDKLLLYLRVVHSIDYYNQVSIFSSFLCFCSRGLQCCGSGLDPDSMGSLDPDPDSQSGSREGRNEETET